MAKLVSNAPNLTLPPFPQHNPQTASLGSAVLQFNLGGPGAVTIQHQPGPPGCQTGPVGDPLQPDPVGLAVAMAGVGEAQGQITVIGEQQGAFAVPVQAAYGVEPLP